MKRTSLFLSEDTHRDLKIFAAEQQTTIGGAVKFLLHTKNGRQKYNYRTPEFKTWVSQVVAAGRAGGDEAAQAYIAENPFSGL